MRLKKIKILGFKSFADKIEINFDEGITAVVGPNGCGKSNIADAFRWVLGEQSAKSMRGSKMPDVIFAGTTNRKALNFAEVTLTLTDIEGKLPVAYEELSVMRRLHRSGESEYFINNHLVRLKDVQTLFLDSGMGKDAYSIFEQGKIEQVINYSPLERRYIFEEAAGILKFLQKKREALRKLEQTDHSVIRIKDIHKEVEQQIIVLEEQSEKAKIYKENRVKLESLEKSSLLFKWEGLQKRLVELQAKGLLHERNIEESSEQIESLQTQLNEAKLDYHNEELNFRSMGEKVFSVRSTKEIKTKEKQNTQERLKELKEKEEKWSLELKELIEKQQYLEGERTCLQETNKETEKHLKTQDKIVKEQLEKVKLIDEEVVKLRLEQNLKQNELLKLLQSEGQNESQIKQTTLRLENIQEKLLHIQNRKKVLSELSITFKGEINDLKIQLEKDLQVVEKKKELFSHMEIDLRKIALTSNEKQEALDSLQDEISDSKARLKALYRLKEDLEGFSSGCKKLISQALDKTSIFFGKIKALYECITPKEGAEVALASIMKPYAQTLVVETKEDFDSVVLYAKKHKILDVSLICKESILDGAKVSFSLKNHKELTSFFSQVIETPLSRHFLQEVYSAKDPLSPLDLIQKNVKSEIIFSDGVFIDKRAVVFYPSNGENNVFLREAEIKHLEEKLIVSHEKREQETAIIQTIEEKRCLLVDNRSTLDKEIRQAEMKLVELNFSLQKKQADLDRAQIEDKTLNQEEKDLNQANSSLQKILEDLNSSYINIKAWVIESKKITSSLNEKVDKLSLNMKQENLLLKEKESLFQKCLQEQQSQIHALHVLEIKDSERSKQKKRLEEELKMGNILENQIYLKKNEVEISLKEAEESLVKVVGASGEMENRLALMKKALENREVKIKEKNQIIKKVETEKNLNEIQKAELQSHLQLIEHNLSERYQLSVSKALEIFVDCERNLEKIEKEIKFLRLQIENSGDINMTSIDECERHKTRYEFLNEQIDDLDLSKKELIGIISNLDSESRKIFQETFQQIREGFKKNFAILFQGGEADLEFTQSEDILEAGIDIIAKPPGKQMRSIHLLSGGEKCLTAMALLFALFEVKPSPFCILDEIDAPLDDTNVERFVNIVRQFTMRCQFIIITHNKRTMAIADVICGVSMEEKGISKLLSIDFNKKTEPMTVLS